MRVLLVEDNDGDADLVAEALGEVPGADVTLTRVNRLHAAAERLETESFDAVLLDLTLPDSSGLDGLESLRRVAPRAAIVVLTGLLDVATGTKAIQRGAQDYLQKGEVRGSELVRALRYASERAQLADRAQLLADVSGAIGRERAPEAMLVALRETLSREYADHCALESGRHTPGPYEPRPAQERRPRLFVSLADVDADDLDQGRLAELAARGIASAIIVPFDVHGWKRGLLTLGRNSASAAYGPADLALAEEMTRRAVAAVEYAALLEIAERERERAEVAGRARDEFLATLSHELRTPLNAILGWTVLMRSGAVAPDKRPQALETIERNARSQIRLIEDVVDVSRIITGKMRLKVGPVAVAHVLAAALESMRPAAEAKGIDLVSVVDGSVTVNGDADRLQQILWNLLSNAVKFTGRGGCVTARIGQTSSSVTVSVTDTGSGISGEFLPHVFERFRQADASATRAHGGLGLGLAIARHLTELQGGTLAAESAGAGKGSTFVMSLPLAVERPERPSNPPAASPASHAARATPPATLAGVAVLVVDDDADSRALMGFMLEANGASVRLAPSAGEGLAALRSRPPDVLVSDIGMAGASGYDLIRDVRALAAVEGGDTPAVAVTAYARLDDRAQALKAGFDQHVSKPVVPDELVAAIAALGLRRRAPV